MPPKKRKLRVVPEEPAPSAKATVVVPLPVVQPTASATRVCPRGCTEILDEHMECPVCESTLINPVKRIGG